MERATANVGRVLLDGITTGRMHSDDWRATTEALDVLRGLPLFFEDEPALSLLDITAKARALVRQHGIKLLVLDYIQLCGGGRGQDKRHHQIEEISRGLKTLAKQLDITILTLSQLSRSVESRVSGKPQLSDLKESGAIEEDADVVMLLSLDHVPEHGPKIIDLDFAKNRQGRVGSVPLAFDGGYQQWADSDVPLGRGRPAKKASYSEDF